MSSSSVGTKSVSGTIAASAQRPAAVSADEARDIASAAYLYFYPLVTMDLTRLQLTNIEAGKEVGKGPMNSFTNVPQYPPAEMRMVVRPNFDTLYSSAWLDLRKEPMVVSAPDTNGRYYLLPMIDMWTDVFASPGSRTTGTQAGNFVVVPPGWSGTLPENLSRIDAPTPFVWIIGRTKTDGPQDYAAVNAIQAGYTITPLSQLGKPGSSSPVKIDPNVDMTTPPLKQVDSMPADRFFTYAAELLKVNPPHITDQSIIALLKRIGFEPGKSLRIADLEPVVQQALKAALAEGQKLMAQARPKIATIVNGWQMNVDTIGVYGNYYLKRAIIAQTGLGANPPEDAIYPFSVTDNNGKSLDGANRYRIHFGKESMPPVRAF
jgi:hypothetical protein